MFYDLLKSRRSVRKFRNREVEKEKIDAILKSALLSPSSRASRPWEFIAVTDGELLKKVSGCRATRICISGRRASGDGSHCRS